MVKPALGHSPVSQPDSLWDVAQYRAFMEHWWPRHRRIQHAAEIATLWDEYYAHLPRFLISRCPFCGEGVIETTDTFSLNGFGWERPGFGFGWVSGRDSATPLAPACPHLRIVAYFLHLHGLVPHELFPDKSIEAGPEVPSLMRQPLTLPGARAVMHELPVGGYGEATPHPRYSVYFVSYFSEDREAWLRLLERWDVHYGFVEYGNVSYELEAAAHAGTLLWLDPADAALPLVGWDDVAFPYAALEGSRAIERTITRAGVRIRRPRLFERMLARLFPPQRNR
jgi:hypothetical protein